LWDAAWLDDALIRLVTSESGRLASVEDVEDDVVDLLSALYELDVRNVPHTIEMKRCVFVVLALCVRPIWLGPNPPNDVHGVCEILSSDFLGVLEHEIDIDDFVFSQANVHEFDRKIRTALMLS
jgi:hypothetical protein